MSVGASPRPHRANDPGTHTPICGCASSACMPALWLHAEQSDGTCWSGPASWHRHRSALKVRCLPGPTPQQAPSSMPFMVGLHPACWDAPWDTLCRCPRCALGRFGDARARSGDARARSGTASLRFSRVHMTHHEEAGGQGPPFQQPEVHTNCAAVKLRILLSHKPAQHRKARARGCHAWATVRCGWGRRSSSDASDSTVWGRHAPESMNIGREPAQVFRKKKAGSPHQLVPCDALGPRLEEISSMLRGCSAGKVSQVPVRPCTHAL